MKKIKMISPKTQEKFSKKLLVLLIFSSRDASQEVQENKSNFLTFASGVESKFYSIVFEITKVYKNVLNIYSDKKFRKIDKRQFYKLVAYSKISGLYYGMLNDLNKNNFGKNLPQFEIEFSLNYLFFLKNSKLVPTPEYTQYQPLKFEKIFNVLIQKGFEKNFCLNFIKALIQLDELSEIYRENYCSFLKTTDLFVMHQNYREFNWAVHSLIGFESRWHPVLQYITTDSRF